MALWPEYWPPQSDGPNASSDRRTAQLEARVCALEAQLAQATAIQPAIPLKLRTEVVDWHPVDGGLPPGCLELLAWDNSRLVAEVVNVLLPRHSHWACVRDASMREPAFLAHVAEPPWTAEDYVRNAG
jgi:hypothetical protein